MKLRHHVLLIAVGISAAWHRLTKPDHVALANTVNVIPGHSETLIADEAIPRNSIVKTGTDADHAGVCDAADIPLGFTRDSEAGIGEPITFAHFGSQGFEYLYSDGAEALGDLLVPANNGALRKLPAVAGTYYVVGVCKVPSTANSNGVARPFGPQKIVVP